MTERNRDEDCFNFARYKELLPVIGTILAQILLRVKEEVVASFVRKVVRCLVMDLPAGVTLLQRIEVALAAFILILSPLGCAKTWQKVAIYMEAQKAGFPSEESLPPQEVIGASYPVPPRSLAPREAPRPNLPVPAEPVLRMRPGPTVALPSADRPFKETPRTILSLPEPQYDIPLALNRRVFRFIRYYQGPGRNEIIRALERSGRYIETMRRIFQEEGLPLDLVYLPLVESGFSPSARSHKGAAGLWQFMRSTGRLYGLEINFWVDERRDPEKATRAAARFLRDLYAEFGSWPLALAAYNAGRSRIASAIRQMKNSDFWKISHPGYLPRETKEFVPKYLAALLMAKRPGAFGLSGVREEAPLSYEVFPLSGQENLRKVARSLDISVDELEALNPELKRGLTPPSKKPYALRIPEGSGEKLRAALTRTPTTTRAIAKKHIVQPGETLSFIARLYDVPLLGLLSLNSHLEPRRLRIGEVVNIPLLARQE